jgi:hypothetical protein
MDNGNQQTNFESTCIANDNGIEFWIGRSDTTQENWHSWAVNRSKNHDMFYLAKNVSKTCAEKMIDKFMALPSA